MAELLTKRAIECVDQDGSKYNAEDMCKSKKVKWDSNERHVDTSEQISRQQQDEDRNNSNGHVKAKVNVSEVSGDLKATISEQNPYRIVVGENNKNRNFDDEAQKASNILKNIVMEKMNDRIADEASSLAFQGVEKHNFQPMVLPLNCRTSQSRPALPVRYIPVQNNAFPPFVRGQNIAAFGNLTSLPHQTQAGVSRTIQQPGKLMVQSIPNASSVTKTLPPIFVTAPNGTIVPPSSGTASRSAGTMTSINDQSLPTTEYFNKISTPGMKAATVQVMPGTHMTYKTPGATFRNRHGKVKRPMNAFMVWARNYRSRLSDEMPHASNAQISVRLGQIWGNMSLVDKEKYFREAERIKLQHNREFPGWVYQPRQKKVHVETQHDRLWARFGSNKELTESVISSCPGASVTTGQQIVTPTPVTVYPKAPIVHAPNVSVTSPLPSFSQMTQTVSYPTPIMSMETAVKPTPETFATIANIGAGTSDGSSDGCQESARRPTAFKTVGNSQAPPSAKQITLKKENDQITPVMSPAVDLAPPKSVSSYLPSTGNAKSLSSTSVGCPSPKGRPPSISRRVPTTPAMLLSSQHANKEAISAKNISSSPNKNLSSGTNVTTSTSSQRQHSSDVTTLSTVRDVTPNVSQRSSKCADPVDELWPFPLPTVEQTHHVDVLYDDHLRYERESGPGYIDPYNPFYYDGSYDETRSGLQVDVNSWQKYLNYTKIQNEAEEKTNLTKYFPPPCTNGGWYEQTSNNADTQQTTYSKPNDQEPRRSSSESCFASSLTSAIHVLDDVNSGGAPDGYTDISSHGYQQNKIPTISKSVVDVQSQSCALQALDLSSGNRGQSSASDIIYLGQETTHLGSGDGVAKSVYVEGSPQDKPEDSRPLKKRTERYRRDFTHGRSCVTSGEAPSGTYLEDVIFLTSPEKAAAEASMSHHLPRQGSDHILREPPKAHTTSPKLVIDVGHDFVRSLRSGTVVTDLAPVDLSLRHTSQPQTTHHVETAGNRTEPCVVAVKKEQYN